jgi:hypothetical protein
MYGLAKKIGLKDKVLPLKSDCDQRGQIILGIEDAFKYLQTRNFNVDIYDAKLGHLSKPWIKIVQKSPIKPLVGNTKVIDGHIRPSEYGCKIARVLSKVNLDKAQSIFGFELDRELATYGTTRHELCLSQHCGHFEHAARAGFPPRYKYSEVAGSHIFEGKETGLEIIISGRPDSRFTFEDNHAVGVIDKKRSRHFYYTKKSHERQTMEYALIVAEQLGYKKIYTIVMEGPFKPEPLKYRMPHVHIMKTDVDGPKIMELLATLEQSFIEQANLLDKLEYLKETKVEKITDARGCFNVDTGYDCFVKPACDSIVTYCVKNKTRLRDVLDEFKLIRKGYIMPQL